MSVGQSILSRVTGFLRPGPGYAGARYIRAFRDWVTSFGSADGEILSDLKLIRSRSRDLFKNNAVGRGAISVLVSNVVGRGIKMQTAFDRDYIAKHNGWSPEQADEFFSELETETERQWERYFETTECDALGQFNGYEKQRLLFTTVLQSGDAFVTFPRLTSPNSDNCVRAGIIEADYVHNPTGSFNNDYLRDGVVLDDLRRPVAYWVNRNTEMLPEKMVCLKALGEKSGRRQVIHLYRAERPEQSRGVPILTPVFEVLKNLDAYKKSELNAALVSSFFTVFIKSNGSGSMLGAFGKQTQPEALSNDFKLGPAAILELPEGKDVTFADTKRPNSGFDGFISALTREIGMALGIPYEILIRHFTQTYTASRASRVEFKKEVRIWREWLILKLCKPWYTEWFIDRVLSGHLTCPGIFDSPDMLFAYTGTKWFGEASGMIDERAEIAAIRERVELGVSTLTEEASEALGNDYEDVMRIQRREKTFREKINMPNVIDIDREAKLKAAQQPLGVDAGGNSDSSIT